EMKKVVKENQTFQKEIISRADAMKMAESGELGALGPRSGPSRFKIDLLNDIPEDEQISLYRNGDVTDLCAGPHVGRTGNCKAFKIMSVASAFYKGDKNRPMLQRIYGTCFPNRTQLDEHLARLEEARRRDHRKLGRELGLFCIDEAVGQGLILWKPKGALIRRSLQDFITEELDKLGYSQVYTPNIGKLDLYRTSGHFPYYRESQYAPIPERDAMEKLCEEGATCAELFNGLTDGTIEGYMLKPMNCPHHIKIYANDAHSYRDLPVRLAEFGTVYRWEQSGELGGMTRVRGFTQDDAHIFCTPDQLAGEIRQCLGIVKTIFGTLGMTDYRVRLSMRDPESDKYVGSPENWDKAEQALRDAAEWLGADYSEEAGEAAFYGPKIDFIVRDAIGREWQLGTVQVDYNLPERFDLHYTGADNKPHRPVMVHRAPFGSMERFTGLLIEHFEGKFPTWLSPEQVRVLPISDKVMDIAKTYRDALASRGVRVTVDETADKIGAKIRNARLERVPYMLVIGQREAEEGTVSVRHRDREDLGSMPFEQFMDAVSREIAERHISPVI
ncbi:MAG: threonine--tRNA ligase, partial [Akkermansia sp.]